jgi:hypothetical protein
MVVKSAAGIRLQRAVGVRTGIAKAGHKWSDFGNACADRIPIRGAPNENRFTVSPTARWVYHVRRS